MAYTNNNGQTRIGVRSGVLVAQTPSASTLWNSIYAVYNGDSVGSSSLKTSLYAVYNGESNTNDSFGTNHGTAVGGLTYTTGKIGNAFTFNGTNAYVILPNNSLNFTGDFSISLWFNTNSASTERQIISNVHKEGGSAGQWKGWNLFTYNSKVYFRLWNSGLNSDVVSTTTLSNSTWYHIIVTKSGSSQKIYVNGNLESTNNSAVTPNYSSPNYPAIGVQYYYTGIGYDTPTIFNGRIDAISSWNKALTQSEITELYNLGNGAQYIGDNFYKPTTNDALLVNNGTAQGGLTYGVGKVGTAFQFNGTNSYVELGDVMDVGTSSWSYSFWFKTNDAVNAGICFSKSFAGGSSGRFWGGPYNNKFAWNFQADTNIIYTETNSGTIVNNTWYHVVCVLDRNDKLKLYINGSLQTVNVTSGTNNLVPYLSSNFNTNHPFRIGAYTSSDNTTPYGFFNGSIDAFNVWNKVLTQQEITELYNSGNGIQYTSQLVPLLLDTYTGATVAYSLRKLRTSYTGYAIRVRRSSDNTSQDIGFKSDGTLDTTSLLSFVGSGNGFVSIWYDQAVGVNARQNTLVNQPMIVNNGSLILLNNKPSIQWNGGNSNLEAPGITTTLNGLTTMGIITVLKPNTQPLQYGKYSHVHFQELGGWGSVYQAATTNMVTYRFGTGESNNTPAYGMTVNNIIFSTYKNGTSEIARVNGTDVITSTRPNAAIQNTNNIVRMGIAEYNTYFGGLMNEVIIYTTNRMTDRVGIDSNINSYYSIY